MRFYIAWNRRLFYTMTNFIHAMDVKEFTGRVHIMIGLRIDLERFVSSGKVKGEPHRLV